MADILQRLDAPTQDALQPSEAEFTSSPLVQQKQDVDLVIQRPKRIELSEEEVLKRMEEFDLRKDKFVAAVREGKNRSLYP